MSDLAASFSGSILNPSWIQVFFILIEGVLSLSGIQVFFILIEGVCLGLGTQEESLDHYSYGRANSRKSCVDQGDHWMIKFKLGLNLFDLIKL